MIKYDPKSLVAEAPATGTETSLFYRGNRGMEVDLIKEKMIGANYELYEIESSKTYRADFSANMKRVAVNFREMRY